MDPRDSARELVRDWQNLFGARLRSALLFGSVARNEYVPDVSNVNVLLLLDQVDAATLKTAAPGIRKWTRKTFQPPLLFEQARWQQAADVFAIELADMRDAHEVLHGEDPLDHADIKPEELRHQTERELRGKLLTLQTGLLVAATTPADVGNLLLKSVPSFATFMRAVLRLSGETVPTDTPQAIRQAAERVGTNPDAILRVWESRVHKKPLKLAVDDKLVEAYYATVEQTADFVDQFGGNQ